MRQHSICSHISVNLELDYGCQLTAFEFWLYQLPFFQGEVLSTDSMPTCSLIQTLALNCLLPSLSRSRRTQGRKIIWSLKHCTRSHKALGLFLALLASWWPQVEHAACVISPLLPGEGRHSSLLAGLSALQSPVVLRDSVFRQWFLFGSFLWPSDGFSLKDGPRGCGGGEERRLQPAVWHLGSRHHSHRAGGASAPHVRPAPHEVSMLTLLVPFSPSPAFFRAPSASSSLPREPCLCWRHRSEATGLHLELKFYMEI